MVTCCSVVNISVVIEVETKDINKKIKKKTVKLNISMFFLAIIVISTVVVNISVETEGESVVLKHAGIKNKSNCDFFFLGQRQVKQHDQFKYWKSKDHDDEYFLLNVKTK